PAAESKDAALGFRWFVGGRGIVHVGLTARRDRQAFTSNYSAWAVGYTQYDLFGTGAFATVNIRLPFDSPGGGGLSPQLVAGVPRFPARSPPRTRCTATATASTPSPCAIGSCRSCTRSRPARWPDGRRSTRATIPASSDPTSAGGPPTRFCAPDIRAACGGAT